MPIRFDILDPNAPAKAAAAFSSGAQQAYELNRQMQANRLAEMQMKAYEQSQQNELARRNALAGATSYADAAKRLMDMGDVEGALKLGKMSSEERRIKAATESSEAATALSRANTINSKLKTMRDQIAGAANPNMAGRVITSFAKDPDLGPILTQGTGIEQIISEIPQDEEGFSGWKNSTVMDADSIRSQISQQLKDAASMQRESFKQTGALPAGVAQPVEGRTPSFVPPPISPEGIPAGRTPKQQAELQMFEEKEKIKSQIKREERAPEVQARKENIISNMDSLIDSAKELRDHPGLKLVTGARLGTETGKQVSSFAYEDAANAKSIQDTIASKIFVNVIGEMKALSQTGATGLGSLAVSEGNKLQSSYANLISTQSTEAYQKRLDDFIKQVEKSKKTISQAAARPKATESAPSERRSLGDIFGGQ